MGIEVSKRSLSMVSKEKFSNYFGVFYFVIHPYLRYLDSYYTYTYKNKNIEKEINKYIYRMSSEKVSKLLSCALFLLKPISYRKKCLSRVSKLLRGSLSVVVLVGGVGRTFVVPVVGLGL